MVNCLNCKKEFRVKPSKLLSGRGKFCSRFCKAVYQKTLTKEKSFAWKGDKVGYRGLHRWIAKWLGRKEKCEFCGKKKTTAKSIHLANVSGNYLRDLSDWVSLCVPCHSKFDRNKK